MQHNNLSYSVWRDARLSAIPQSADELRIDISDPTNLTVREARALLTSCRRHNFALFRFTTPALSPERQLIALGQQLGLKQLDRNLCAEDSGLTALAADAEGKGKRYIPYTNRPLSWHTDGYYNPPERQIRAWLLYCAQNAVEGGENAILNHEIAYIRLRDHDPALAEALRAADAFTVPANADDGTEIRGAQSGPVFSWMLDNDQLHMRYSARQRNIEWQQTEPVQTAADFLSRLFSEGDDHIFNYRLEPGEGLLSNNVLHRRTGFTDDSANGRRRLVYRARYYDRIANT